MGFRRLKTQGSIERARRYKRVQFSIREYEYIHYTPYRKILFVTHDPVMHQQFFNLRTKLAQRQMG